MAIVQIDLSEYDIVRNRIKELGKKVEELEDAAKCYINTIEERLGGKLNMETLEVEKPECEFKPLQYVLARDNSRTDWTLCQFSHIDKQGDVIFVGGDYTDKDNVIPYEGNEHLLGTTDNWEE